MASSSEKTTSDVDEAEELMWQQRTQLRELRKIAEETEGQRKNDMPSSSSSSSSKKMTLMSSDGELFEVEEAVAEESQTIKLLIEDGCADGVITLSNVSSMILAKVIQYCEKHVYFRKSGDPDEAIMIWDAAFVDVDQPTLFELILAAHYLDLKSLLDLTCKTVADMMKGKTTEQIRETFNIINDFTPEEEDEMRRSNQWAYQ